MTKEKLKEYISYQIDRMDEAELQELSQFLEEKSDEEHVAEELIVIHGEFKKLTKLVQSMQGELNRVRSQYSKSDMMPFITLYKFLKNSQDALGSMPEPSLFGMKRFDRAFGAFVNGFDSIGELYESIIETVGLELSAQKGDLFDPDRHEAVEVLEDKNLESGVIVEVLEEGFLYKGELLNYAKVKVNRWIS